MTEGAYRVYEVVNFDAAEIVIGVAPAGTDVERLSKAAVRDHWPAADRVAVRIVEDSLSLEQAAQFAISYSESDALKPFTVLLGPDLTVAA